MIYLVVAALTLLGADPVRSDSCTTPCYLGSRFYLHLPAESDNTADYVSLVTSQLPGGLTEGTMCVWLEKEYTSSRDGRFYFSYAFPGGDANANDLAFLDQGGQHRIFLRGKKFSSHVGVKEGASHVCWTWVGESGKVTLQVDGEAKVFEAAGDLGTGNVLTADGGMLFLGQDQTTVGGGLTASQSWRGKMWDMIIWDKALDTTELHTVFTSTGPDVCTVDLESLPQPLLGWNDFRTHGVESGAAKFKDELCVTDFSHSLRKTRG